jgi:tRNA pseudouridine38-40 synthase
MRWALGLAYDGRHFSGWQCQEGLETLQKTLESALSYVADESIRVQCAGRTDRGVHATSQVVTFSCDKPRSSEAWVRGGNTRLPESMSVLWAKEVSPDFHARFSALSRRYCYYLHLSPNRSCHLPHQVTWMRGVLDVEKMHKAAQCLVGKHNFQSFRASQCQSKHAIRCVQRLSVEKNDKFIVIDITANAFLHHMVRNIVGSLLEVGKGGRPVEWMQALLEAEDRQIAAKTASPDGLYFVEVKYPEEYNLPVMARFPLFV